MRTMSDLRMRERFQSLLAEISSDLLGLELDDLLLDGALRRLAEYFDVGILSLWWFDETRESASRSHYWVRAGLDPGEGAYTLSESPWLASQVLAGEVTRVSDCARLPPEAALERAEAEATGWTAIVMLPLRLGANLDLVGCGEACMYGPTRIWTDREVKELQLAFNVVATAEARMRAGSDLRRREHFQTLLAEISSHLLQAHLGDVAERIEHGLERVSKDYALDRASLWWFEESSDMSRRSHEWARSGMEGPRENFMAQKTIPWTSGVVLGGQTVKLETLDDIPSEQKADRAFFEAQGVKSTLAIPLFVDRQLVGIGVFSTVQQSRLWPERTVNELRLIAETLANAHARSEAMETVRRSERDPARSELLAGVGSYSFYPEPLTTNMLSGGQPVFSKELSALTGIDPGEDE